MRNTTIRTHLPLFVSLLGLGILHAGEAGQTVTVTQVIQAEDFSGQEGCVFASLEESDPRFSVKACGATDWLQYDSINFLDGEYDSVYLYGWTVWEVKEWITRHYHVDGSSVVFRFDSPTGPVAATIMLHPTPMWGYEPATRIGTSLARTTGFHSLFMTFVGGDTICEVDKFTLVGRSMMSSSDARVYYVSGSTGNNAYDGLTLERPFRTIQKAASVMKPGSSCLIRQGIYRETFRPAYTGLPGLPLTFKCFESEDVFVSGADTLGNWTLHKGNIWKAPMEWTMGRYDDQILIDGKMAVAARSPNLKEYYSTWPDWDVFPPVGYFNWSRWSDSIDQMLIPARVPFDDNGSHSLGPRTVDFGIDRGIVPYQLPGSLFGKPADFYKGAVLTMVATSNGYWAEKALVTASSSPTANRLLLQGIPLNMNNDLGGAGYLSNSLNLLDAPNEWLHQDGFAYLYPPSGISPASHLIEAKRRLVGLDARGKQYINVEGIKFIATSATFEDASNCVIDKCEFKYISHYDSHEWWDNAASLHNSPLDPSDGSRGIFISGSRNIIRNSLVAVSAAAGIILSGRHNQVVNCRIRDIDYGLTYYSGVYIMRRDGSDDDDAVGMTLEKNTIYNCGRATINFQGSGNTQTPSDRHTIRYNDLGRMGWLSTEVTSIGMEGSPRRVDISYNWFHDVCGFNATYFGCDCGWGCRQTWLHHNVFWNGNPVNAGSTFDRAGAHWVFCQEDTGATGSLVFNNTVVDSSLSAHRDWDLTGTRFNNIYASGDTALWKFADPARRDYSLRPGSPAEDKGSAIPPAYVAAMGFTPAYSGSAPDLGAYELGGPHWAAGADWQEEQWMYPPVSLSPIDQRMGNSTTSRMGSLRLVPGRITVTMPGGRKARFTICDAQGRTIVVKDLVRGGQISISTKPLSCGIYFARLACGNWSMTRKLGILR